MNLLRTISSMALMLAFTGGLTPLASAQQTYPYKPQPAVSASGSAPMASETVAQSDDGMKGMLPGNPIQIQERQGIRYVSGGVGESERAALRALSDQFNVRLLFALQESGKYLADVQVTLMDANGRPILDAVARGPWFFAQLPSGAYRVQVQAQNRIQQQTVRINDSGQARLNFYWES